MYVAVVILSEKNDNKLLQQFKLGFKTTIKLNKYRSRMTIQSNNYNLNYLIDSTFAKVNRLFVLSLARNDEGDHRDSFQNYYLPNVEVKDFNVLIDGKSFFDLPVKNEKEAYGKLTEINRNNDYTTGNLLDFAYFEKDYRLIAIDLSKQPKLKDHEQINFIDRLEKQGSNNNNGATMFFIIEKSDETTCNFYKILWTSYKNRNGKDWKFVK